MYLIKKILYAIMFCIILTFVCTNIVKATTVEITTETLNLRKEPSTDSDIVALISIGDECEVLGEEEDWYQVQYGDYTGYISKEYAKVIDGDSETGSGSNTPDNSAENETNTVDTENDQRNTEVDNNSAEPTNQNEDGENVTTVAQNIKATTTARTNVRITPLINSSVIGRIANNSEVTIINQINGWAFIQTDEVSGWVRMDSLEVSESGNDSQSGDNQNDNSTNNNEPSNDENADNSSDNTSDFTEKTMYTTDFVNIRKEPSTSADKVMVVEQNTALQVVGESGDWYEVETSQGNAYVLKELLSDQRVAVTNRGNIDRTKDEKEEEVESDSASDSSNTSNNSITGEKIVSYAKKFLGVPYVYGGASPSGFDCSGFTMYVYDNFGISMRHGAQAQAKLGQAVKADKSSKSSLLKNLKVGDLVFFLDYETMDEIGHCGIYIGDGNFIHASSGSGYCVKINSLLPGEYYNTRYCAARRVI